MYFIIALFFAEGDVGTFPFILISVFIIIGIVLIVKGLKKVIKNIKTNNYGEIVYGYIQNLYPDGNYVNGSTEYKADIYTYIPSTNSTETISEVIGFDSMKYPVNTYIKGKYYEGDINIEERVNSYQELPINAQYCFQTIEDQKVDNENIIIVNGMKYKKIEEDNK